MGSQQMMRPALCAVLLVAVVGAMSVELEDSVAPMHPVELGSGGVDAAVVRKTVKEVEFKNSRVGKDSAGMDMNAALHEVERKVLAGGHPIQDSKAKPLKPKRQRRKRRKMKRQRPRSLLLRLRPRPRKPNGPMSSPTSSRRARRLERRLLICG